MSGMLSKAIKANILTGTIKYKNNQEKIGEVLAINKDANTCTVNVITRDGIQEVIYNVRVNFNDDGFIPWFPKVGDFVKVNEQSKRFSITGKIDLSLMNETKVKLYSDVYPDVTGGGGGFVGY